MISVFSQSVLTALKRILEPATLIVWGLVAAAGVAMGPLGTYATLDLLERAVFWTIACSSSVFFGTFLREVIARFIPDQDSYLFDIATVLGMTLLFTPFLLLLITAMIADVDPGLTSTLQVTVVVALVSTLIMSVRRLYEVNQSEQLAAQSIEARLSPPRPLSNRKRSQAAEPAPEPQQPDCRLRNRLPDTITGQILHLSARDHFVDVSLEGTLYTLRMRFADAVAEMDGVEGYLTHRSHWVALAAVQSSERINGKIYLVLSNGSRVPVSRTARPRLEIEGVI